MRKKTIVITGATRGIGKELTFHFASRKMFDLALISRDEFELNELKKNLLLKYPNVDVLIFSADISNQVQVKRMFNYFKDEGKNIDVLINNAAIAGPVGSISDLNLDDFKYTVDVNLYGGLNCTIEALKSMKKDCYGKIINFCGAGVGWDSKAINKSAYITSKYALYGLNESLSRELQPFNIDINCISPGSYETSLRDSLISKDVKKPSAQKLDDVSNTLGRLIDFLISSQSDGLTGKILSAIYDTPDKLLNDLKHLKNSSDNTIRKIDRVNYFGKDA